LRSSAWIFRTSDTGRSIQDLAKAEKPEQSLNALINAARASRGLPVPDAENRKLYEIALVPIKVEVLGRGVPQDLSRVYALSDAKFSTLQNSPREEDGHVTVSHLDPLPWFDFIGIVDAERERRRCLACRVYHHWSLLALAGQGLRNRLHKPWQRC
jgi:hypothetical protein